MKRLRGFTLVEILVALAVVGIGLAALIGASGRATSEAADLRDRTFANWVAQNVLTEMRISPETLETGTKRGDALMGGQRWEWTAEISQAGVPQLRHIRIQVGHEDTEGSIVTMVAFRLTEPQLSTGETVPAQGGRQ